MSAYEFCLSNDKRLGRRICLSLGGLPLAGEKYASDTEGWVLDSSILNGGAFPSITEESARASYGAVLDLPNADRKRPKGRREGHQASLDRAISETWDYLDSATIESTVELLFGRPGTWDYDYEINKIDEIKSRFRKLEALCNERRGGKVLGHCVPVANEPEPVANEPETAVGESPGSKQYPVPDRSDFTPNEYRNDPDLPEGDLGAYEDLLADGRPYRYEVWFTEGMTLITLFFSVLDIESASLDELSELVRPVVVRQRVPEEYQRVQSGDVKKIVDASGNEMYSLTFVVGEPQ